MSAQETTNNPVLTQATDLIRSGQPAVARKVLADIHKGDSNYGLAKALDALCIYQIDRKKFLVAAAAPEIQNAALPNEIAEDLDFKRIETLSFYRKFEELPIKVAEFRDKHPESVRLIAVAEYETANLYERGIKKMIEAGLLSGDDAAFRKAEGRSNLVEFLKLAVALDETNYVNLPDRKLRDDITKAEIALGNESMVMQHISDAERENTAFYTLQLHCHLQPLAADDNLQRMTDFLASFPGTKHRKRVMYDMANVALEEGWRLTWKSKPARAAIYLNMARDLFGSVNADLEAGILEADVTESQIGIMRVFYAKQDWNNLSIFVTQMLTNFPAGSKNWLIVKLYKAAGLACQKNSALAASELDELLAIGFKGNPSYDGPLVSAAEWRIRVAKQAGDGATIQRIAGLVESSPCYGSLKRTFANDFKELTAQN